jgi:hypothetical protein
MTRAVSVFLVWLSLASVAACEPRKDARVNNFDAAADLRAMQLAQGVTIGWVTGDSVEYFDWLDGMKERKVSAGRVRPSVEQPKAASGSSLSPNVPASAQDVRLSANGSSAVYRQPEGFYLASSQLPKPIFLLSGKDVLTALSWSPDGEYLLFAQLDRDASWRETISCGGDIHLIKIVRVKDTHQATAFPTCEGFPYWAVQWIHVPH